MSASTLGAVGDSITAGPNVGVTGWPEALQVLYGGASRVANVAVSGAQVAAIATQFESKVRGRYGRVGVLGGINDLKAGTSAATIFTSLQAIYNNARSSGMTPVPITVLPASTSGGWTGAMQTELVALNALITGYCTTNGIACVDAYNSALRSGTALAAIYDSGDGYHPNQAGENYLATLVQAVAP